MNFSFKISKLTYFAAVSAVAVLVVANVGIAWADHHHHGDQGGATSNVPVHGPGSSHNPIVYHPVHGPGSSHNPIVYHPVHGPGSSHNPIVTTSSPRGGGRCGSPGGYLPCGTAVHDHRNGKNCSYVAGEYGTYAQYRKCEGM
jgi:hypothetical protein